MVGKVLIMKTQPKPGGILSFDKKFLYGSIPWEMEIIFLKQALYGQKSEFDFKTKVDP